MSDTAGHLRSSFANSQRASGPRAPDETFSRVEMDFSNQDAYTEEFRKLYEALLRWKRSHAKATPTLFMRLNQAGSRLETVVNAIPLDAWKRNILLSNCSFIRPAWVAR